MNQPIIADGKDQFAIAIRETIERIETFVSVVAPGIKRDMSQTELVTHSAHMEQVLVGFREIMNDASKHPMVTENSDALRYLAVVGQDYLNDLYMLRGMRVELNEGRHVLPDSLVSTLAVLSAHKTVISEVMLRTFNLDLETLAREYNPSRT